MDQFVYLFNEGNGKMRELLGGKGANLAEMTRIGLPVPYGFTITTQACNAYYEASKTIPTLVEKQTLEALSRLEEKMGKKTGRPTRSIARFRSFRFCFFHAWDDGYNFKPWDE